MSSHLNLLPAAVQRRQAIGKLLRGWAWVSGGALAVAILITCYQWQLSTAVAKRHSELQKSSDSTHQTLQNVKRLRRELAAMESRESVALSLASEKPVLTLLGLFASAAQAQGGSVAIEHLTFLSAVLPGKDSAARPANPTSHVELRGVATSNVALAEFVAAIRAWDVFTQVDLRSTGATQIGSTPARSFSIECAY